MLSIEVAPVSGAAQAENHSDMTDKDAAPKVGIEVIQGYLKTLDTSPGVYRMLDAESRVQKAGCFADVKHATCARACRLMRAPLGIRRALPG